MKTKKLITVKEAIAKYPRSPAVLVRDHGIYVGGATWQQAKGQTECLDYIFNILLERRRCGLTSAITPERSVKRVRR